MFDARNHPGGLRKHNAGLVTSHRRDKGADIPTRTDFGLALKLLPDRFGNEAGLNIILFTLDEKVYARELAPLAGHRLADGEAAELANERTGDLARRGHSIDHPLPAAALAA